MTSHTHGDIRYRATVQQSMRPSLSETAIEIAAQPLLSQFYVEPVEIYATYVTAAVLVLEVVSDAQHFNSAENAPLILQLPKLLYREFKKTQLKETSYSLTKIVLLYGMIVIKFGLYAVPTIDVHRRPRLSACPQHPTNVSARAAVVLGCRNLRKRPDRICCNLRHQSRSHHLGSVTRKLANADDQYVCFHYLVRNKRARLQYSSRKKKHGLLQTNGNRT